MNKTLGLLVAAAAMMGAWSLGAPAAAGGEEAVQALKGSATTFELKMRILEGSREAPVSPDKPVTASFLQFQNLVNFDSAEDVQVEAQIKTLYNLKALSLVTEAPLVWEKGQAEKAVHMFRLNGQDYLVRVTPGQLIDRNQFRIEVNEQAQGRTTSLLDTEFSLPDRSAAVFGFENTQGKPYFIVLRLSGWGGVLSGVTGGLPPRRPEPPKLIKKVDPVYPEAAKKAGVEGSVILEATTDAQGRVASVRVLRSVPLLDQAAIDALKRYVYEPMVVGGEPRPFVFTVTMKFRLDDQKMPQVSSDAGFEGLVKPPKLVKKVDPAYPEIARQARVEGSVILEATTDRYGKIANVRVLRSIPLLDQAAVDALRQWVYEPMVIDGKPQPVTFTVTMQFKLDGEKGPQVSGSIAGVEGGVAGGVSGGVRGGVTKGVEGGVEGGVVGGVAGGVAGGLPAQDLAKFEADAVRAVGNIEPPKLVKQVNPVYPQVARKGRVEGMVILEAKIDERGNVMDVRVLRSIPLLDQAAVDAVKQWKYEPLLIDGKARKAVFTVTVRFMLQGGDKDKLVEKFAKGAVKIEGDIKPPKLVKEAKVVYPEIARMAGVQGVVILSVRTDETGKVVDAIVLRSIPLLDQAAIDAVRQWVYEPTVIDGKPAPVVFTVTVRFKLQ